LIDRLTSRSAGTAPVRDGNVCETASISINLSPYAGGVNGKLGAILLPALGVALAIGLWWLATAVFPVNAALVPGPGAVGTLLLSKAYP
jgi:hypothetical protein